MAVLVAASGQFRMFIDSREDEASLTPVCTRRQTLLDLSIAMPAQNAHQRRRDERHRDGSARFDSVSRSCPCTAPPPRGGGGGDGVAAGAGRRPAAFGRYPSCQKLLNHPPSEHSPSSTHRCGALGAQLWVYRGPQ